MQDRNYGYRIEGSTALKADRRRPSARIIAFPAQSLGDAPHSARQVSEYGCTRRTDRGRRPAESALARMDECDESKRFTSKESAVLVCLFGILGLVITLF